MSYDHILYEQADSVAMLTLYRPERLNALDIAMAKECLQALAECKMDETTRVLLITGAGRAFSAGGDIHAMAASLDADPALYMEHLVGVLDELALAVFDLPKPVIAALNGAAVGAGLCLALACDLRVAASEATLHGGFLSLGLVPDTGGSYLLPRLVGLAKAAELLLLDVTLTAREAATLGLINRVVPGEALLDEAWVWAEKLSKAPPQALARTKALLQQGLTNSLAQQMAQELSAQVASSRTTDYRERVAAFLEKRRSALTGE